MQNEEERHEKRVATSFEQERKSRVREKLKSSQVAAAHKIQIEVRTAEGEMREEANKQFIRKVRSLSVVRGRWIAMRLRACLPSCR